MNTNKVLAKRLIDLLTDQAIEQVNFRYKSIIVTGMRYSLVAEALANGRLKCQVGIPPLPDRPGFVRKASYEIGGVIHFRDEYFGYFDYEKLDMLHEATHAMHDLFATQTSPVVISAIDNELVSTLACALFSRLTMVNRTRPSGSTYHFAASEVGGFEEDAIALADRVLLYTGDGKDPRTIGVDHQVTRTFRDKVARFWNLVDGRAGIVDLHTGYK